VTALVVAVGLGLWQLASMTFLADSPSLPSPTEIVRQIVDDGWSFYGPNIATTTREAGWGWLWGTGIAIALAVVFVQLPSVERWLMRVAVAAACLPIIAIGPVLQIVFDGETPKIVLAALSCFFFTLIGTIVGLRSADRASLDLVAAAGGGSWSQLRTVRSRASLPSLFAALRIAAPTALLGAMIGEYLGGDSGLGVAMVNAQRSLQVTRTWGIAVVAALIAGAAYAVTALAGRLLTPWAPGSRSGTRSSS
jgi:ABC-type nitrate/sulfonate/bicarbonate transport system permease component